MTDPQALRRVAERLQQAGDALDAIHINRLDEAADYLDAKADFQRTFDPPTILALLDDRDRLARRVEAAERLRDGIDSAQRLYLKASEEECRCGTDDECLACSTFMRAVSVLQPLLTAFDTERGEG